MTLPYKQYLQQLLLVLVVLPGVFTLGCGSGANEKPGDETENPVVVDGTVTTPDEDQPAPIAPGNEPDEPVVSEPANVTLTHNTEEEKVDVTIDGQYFTSYLYGHPLLNKSVLFPVVSPSGHTLTRGYPIDTREGEPTDHTHQHGVWFNHGDVNGIDFWNTGRTPPKDGVRYGRIVHQDIIEMTSGDTGTIKVAKNWYDDAGRLMLQEQATYEFEGSANTRIMTLTTTLTALDQDIEFEDSKEALFAIRTSKELEVQEGNTNYLNSEGVAGYPDVWGKRAAWMQLKGNLDNTPISILIFDDKNNVNHPPHWMARDYGLFAVNNLGNSAYGDSALNYTLPKGGTETFVHQLVVIDNESVDAAQINTLYNAFIDRQN